MCNGFANNLDHFIDIFNFRRIVPQPDSTRWQEAEIVPNFAQTQDRGEKIQQFGIQGLAILQKRKRMIIIMNDFKITYKFGRNVTPLIIFF
jgi:hypothetical protein